MGRILTTTLKSGGRMRSCHWFSKERHKFGLEEVKRAIDQKPDTIVIGTGESGLAEVTPEAQEEIKRNGIKLVIDKTEEAARTFNVIKEDSEEEKGKQEKVIGLFHLTC